MGKRKNYPANLLEALQIQTETQSDILHDELSEDQYKGLEYAMSVLTEREKFVLNAYFAEGKTIREFSKEYNLSENRIKQIIDHALRKLRRNKEWLFYIVNGYEAQRQYLWKQLLHEERKYLVKHGIYDHSHLYYQEISVLNLPARIYNPLIKHGIRVVRDLVVFVCTSEKIRNFGEMSVQVVCDVLKRNNLLPMDWQTQRNKKTDIPRLDLELNAFIALNRY